MGRVLYMIIYYYNSRQCVTLTFDIWPWPFSLTLILMFDLEVDILQHWCFEENIAKKINVWRHVTQTRYVIRDIGENIPDRYFFRNILRPTKSFYDFWFQSYGSKCDFHGFRYVWPWPWHFKVIWLLRIHLVFPCMTGVNFEVICSLIAEI